MRVGPWLLTTARCAIWGDVAVVADLHLGYGRVRRHRGESVPMPTVVEELEPLARVVDDYAIKHVVVAGDLFEDGRTRPEDELLAWLNQHSLAMTVVPGNHDRGLVGSRLHVVDELMLGPWHVVHGDGPTMPEGCVVQGHEHPWLRWRVGVEGPCYLMTEYHLVLPAYSADAAGVNVRGRLRWSSHCAYVIAGNEVLDFGAVGRLIQ